MEIDLSIQRMAERCGLSAYTLRYYESAGLIQPVARAVNGHRRYSVKDQSWIEFLNRLRVTGMTVRQMAQFARLRAQGDQTAAARRAMLEAHRGAVQARVVELEDSLRVLKEKIKHYRALEHSMTPPAALRHTPGRRYGQSLRARTEEAGRNRRSTR